jgi:TnpA family transposase
MPTKTILSPAQRAAIFDPSADRATVERLYTLDPDDLAQMARRRRGANRIGYAVQLCYLRHPGRGLLTSEAVPDAMLALLADQIGCVADDFTG